MTARQIFEFALIEINKVEAPSLLLEDYNYFINKAVLQYVNKRYNIYDVNQQVSDDLRVLKGTATITNFVQKPGVGTNVATYTAVLPDDYYHILNCIVMYNPALNFRCYKPNETVEMSAKRLTADMYSGIVNNVYMRPSYKNPYFYLHNDVDPAIVANVPTAGVRDGNSVPVNIEIRYGKDNTIFVLTKAHIDYLKVPRYINLTQTQYDSTLDTSQELEFPNYVCLEIIKELVALLMENASDQRLQTNLPVNQSIAMPQQGQQPAHNSKR